MPKKPMSAYMLFAGEARKRICEAQPELKVRARNRACVRRSSACGSPLTPRRRLLLHGLGRSLHACLTRAAARLAPQSKVTEQSKLIGEEWKALTEEEKEQWTAKAAADVERYEQEVSRGVRTR